MSIFNEFNLNKDLLLALDKLGYETPTPVQREVIPAFFENHDLLVQAQTGTGKTAAFALPILTKIDINNVSPQALILTPTRELALQVAEAFKHYAKYIPTFQVIPIYGGQNFRTQLRILNRGVHVIVGTPGRIIDHLTRGTIATDDVKTLVLDEADEMLKMGFIDDVEWIMKKFTTPHQTALFSATLPQSIKKIAKRYLHHPKLIEIQPKETTMLAIDQFHIFVAQSHKVAALIGLLEIETFDAAIIFTRTKNISTELAETLCAQGYACAALNGDLDQSQREKVIQQLKNKAIDIIVATDVAARGIDIPRITHVINFDAPTDIDAYTHRIGRTGRAGREGKAILFVTLKEQRILRNIHRVTGYKTVEMKQPTTCQLNKKRQEKFTAEILTALSDNSYDRSYYQELITTIIHEHEVDILNVAAALAYLAQKDKLTFPVNETTVNKIVKNSSRINSEAGMTACKIALGHKHKIQPRQIVGLIANRANISSKLIGNIDIQNDHTVIHLAADIAESTIKTIGRVKLANGLFQLKRMAEAI